MLFFAIVGLLPPILFPVLPWVWSAVVLQFIIGLTTTMSWDFAQPGGADTAAAGDGRASSLRSELEASFIVTRGVLLLIVGSVMVVLSWLGLMPRRPE